MDDARLGIGGSTSESDRHLAQQNVPNDPFRQFVRLLYVHNPFYAISASLVFWGLESSFNLNVYHFQMFALMGGLVAYTLVLALAAFVVIRLGKVWDDGRSLLLLVVLMLLAISISFDGALIKFPRNGTLCSVGGLAFAVLVSEGLLHTLAIRLRWLFRLPYYLFLGLFFLYPVALRWTVCDDPDDTGVQWAIYAFPWLAAIICLLLLPAVRRGAKYAEQNGTPWPWPWFPWTMFFMLGLGACGRSFYLAMSMHLAGGFTTIFGPWFLVPFLLAVSVLLLEGGLVTRSVAVQRAAMVAPLVLILFALYPPSGKLSVRFIHDIVLPTLGTGPLFLTMTLVTAFYGWAMLRRAAWAGETLSAVLVMSAFIGPETGIGTGLYLPPQAYPILALAAMQGLFALLRPSAPRWLLAASCAVAAAILWRPYGSLASNLLAAHMQLAAMMLIGGLFAGRFARGLQNAAAAMLFFVAVAAMTGWPAWVGRLPTSWLVMYTALAILIAAGYGWLVRNRMCIASAAAALACWMSVGGMNGYRQARVAIAGLGYIACGAASLIVAMLISLGKSGYFRRPTRGRSAGRE